MEAVARSLPKMAHGQLLLNGILCFLVNKFGKVDVKSLKTALFDICDVDTVITECKVTANEISNQIKSNLILSQ